MQSSVPISGLRAPTKVNLSMLTDATQPLSTDVFMEDDKENQAINFNANQSVGKANPTATATPTAITGGLSKPTTSSLTKANVGKSTAGTGLRNVGKSNEAIRPVILSRRRTTVQPTATQAPVINTTNRKPWTGSAHGATRVNPEYENAIRELEAYDQTLEERMKESEEKKRQQQIQSLELVAQNIERERATLQGLLQEVKAERNLVKEQIEKERATYTDLKVQLMHANQKHAIAVSEKAMMDKTLEKEAAKVEQAIEELAKVQASMAALQRDKAMLESAVKSESKEVEKVLSTRNGYVEQIQELNLQCETIKTSIESRRQVERHLALEINKQNHDIASLEHELQDLQMQSDDASRKTQELDGHIQDLEDKLLIMDVEMEKLNDMLAAARGEASMQEDLLDRFVQDSLDLIRVMQDEVDELENRKADLAKNIAQKKAEMFAQQKASQSNKVDMENQAREIRSEIEALRAEIHHAEVSCSDQQKAVDHINKELKEKSDELEKRQAIVDSIHKQVASKQEELDQLKCDYASLQQVETDLRNSIASQHSASAQQETKMRHDLEQMKFQYNQLKIAKDTKLSEIQEAKIQVLLKHKPALQELHLVKGQHEELEHTLHRLESERMDVQSRLNKLLSDMSDEKHTYASLESESMSLDMLLANQDQQMQEDDITMRKNEEARRYMHNVIQELRGNIRVFCRIRPVNDKDQSQSSSDANGHVHVAVQADESANKIVAESRHTSVSGGKGESKVFAFDRVFGMEAGQQEVFDEVSQVVQSALDGYRVCLFAYGQTGSGKTYTMFGSNEQPGIIPLSMDKIFKEAEKLKEQRWSFSMEASVLEIYNEEVRDLLVKPASTSVVPGSRDSNSSGAHDKKLQVKIINSNRGSAKSSGPSSDITLTDLTRHKVFNKEEIDNLMNYALENRTTACTNMNERSSRSHSIFRLYIEGTNASTNQELKGMLNLIDLAGSERIKKTNPTKEQEREAININSSLTCLGNCISALASKNSHVPYRDSKLTYILQDDLGNDCKTLMFVNLSPIHDSLQESLCSLQFAQKVSTCQIGTAQRRVDVSFSE